MSGPPSIWKDTGTRPPLASQASTVASTSATSGKPCSRERRRSRSSRSSPSSAFSPETPGGLRTSFSSSLAALTSAFV